MPREIMYDQNSILIAAILLALLALAMEVGHRLGLRNEHKSNDPLRSQINTIQTSLLGVLALLLAFTFSLALQRYEARSAAVVAEANAIGTAWLRTDLISDEVQPEIRQAMRDYVRARLEAGVVSLDQSEARAQRLQVTEDLQARVWALVSDAARADPSPATTGLLVQAVNDMIDRYGERNAALDRHVPEIVLFLLFGTFAMTGVLVGYASGLAGLRAPFASYVLVTLIVLLVFLIIDLDRPRRGLIEVGQAPLIQLAESIGRSPP